jgi:hypothetical protein
MSRFWVMYYPYPVPEFAWITVKCLARKVNRPVRDIDRSRGNRWALLDVQGMAQVWLNNPHIEQPVVFLVPERRKDQAWVSIGSLARRWHCAEDFILELLQKHELRGSIYGSQSIVTWLSIEEYEDRHLLHKSDQPFDLYFRRPENSELLALAGPTANGRLM